MTWPWILLAIVGALMGAGSIGGLALVVACRFVDARRETREARVLAEWNEWIARECGPSVPHPSRRRPS